MWVQPVAPYPPAPRVTVPLWVTVRAQVVLLPTTDAAMAPAPSFTMLRLVSQKYSKSPSDSFARVPFLKTAAHTVCRESSESYAFTCTVRWLNHLVHFILDVAKGQFAG